MSSRASSCSRRYCVDEASEESSAPSLTKGALALGLTGLTLEHSAVPHSLPLWAHVENSYDSERMYFLLCMLTESESENRCDIFAIHIGYAVSQHGTRPFRDRGTHGRFLFGGK